MTESTAHSFRLVGRQYKHTNELFGSRHAMSMLLLASMLLLVRETFSVVTVNNSAKQNSEDFWYPLIATPEVLVTMLFTIPGLVPRRQDLQERLPQQMELGKV